jgi:hypothetical protein
MQRGSTKIPRLIVVPLAVIPTAYGMTRTGVTR